jgi:hypothetical protein
MCARVPVLWQQPDLASQRRDSAAFHHVQRLDRLPGAVGQGRQEDLLPRRLVHAPDVHRHVSAALRSDYIWTLYLYM